MFAVSDGMRARILPPGSAFPQHGWLAALEASSAPRSAPPALRGRFPKVAYPDILEDLAVSLLRYGGERRSLRSAKETLPSVGLVHDKTWQRGRRWICEAHGHGSSLCSRGYL
jgi:hypothetical protein